MELHQLQLLRAVIESGGYAPAGKLLHVSHSAIHRQIRLLEQELGCRLLARSGRSVKPTESGRLLVDLNLRLCQAIADAQCQIDELNNLTKGHLRIGTSSSILVSFLPGVLRRFSNQFPGVHLHLATGIADDLIEEVLEGKLDMGILFNPADFPRPLPELDWSILYVEEFDWAVGKTHPLAKQSQIALSELAAYPLITPPPRSHVRRACDRLFAAAEIVPTVITEVENEEAIDKLIEVDLGFAARSRRRPANEKIRCFQIPGYTIQCEVGMVWRKKNNADRAFREFVRVCQQVRMAG